jgi:SAM-dependent methyltransferase
MSSIANVDMAAAWDGDEGAHWAANADRYERGGRRVWQQFADRVPIPTDAAVLDIGCGTGRSTRAVARVASSGSVLGVDLSTRMLAEARARAEREGVTNVRFEQADAQVHPFAAGAFDLVISSFGVMFFADPVAAFRNIGQALRPGGRLAMLAWRDVDSNAWIKAVRDALAVGRELPLPPPDAPGPFAFARPEHVRRVLGDAGFTNVDLTEINVSMDFGKDATEAFAFVGTMGATKGLTGDLDAESKQRAMDALERMLTEHQTDEGVQIGSASWLITATRQ